jgi:hypothetical protein
MVIRARRRSLHTFLSKSGVDEIVGDLMDFREISLEARATLVPSSDERLAVEVRVEFTAAGFVGSVPAGSLSATKIAPLHGCWLDESIIGIALTLDGELADCAWHLVNVRDKMAREIESSGEYPTGVLLLQGLRVAPAFRGQRAGLSMIRMLMRLFAGQPLLVAGCAHPMIDVVEREGLDQPSQRPRLLAIRTALVKYYLSDPVLRFASRSPEYPFYFAASWTGWEAEDETDHPDIPTIAVDPRRLSLHTLCQLAGDELGTSVYEACHNES